MRSVFAYPAFQFLVLTLDDAIAGFMFGYEVDIDRLNAEKLGIDAIRWQTCRAAIDTLARRPISRVFYRADLGVDPAAR